MGSGLQCLRASQGLGVSSMLRGYSINGSGAPGVWEVGASGVSGPPRACEPMCWDEGPMESGLP
eukprot:3448723-Pyramimonas_sp.AAC.1